MKVWACIAGALLMVVIVIALFLSAVNRTGCWWYGKQTQREVRYAPFVGCMVKLDDKWFLRSELRVAQ